jgi:hypothetical protein
MADGDVACQDRAGVDLRIGADRDLALHKHRRVDIGRGIDIHPAVRGGGWPGWVRCHQHTNEDQGAYGGDNVDGCLVLLDHDLTLSLLNPALLVIEQWILSATIAL